VNDWKSTKIYHLRKLWQKWS